jgi:hypothetical protein
MRDFTAGFSASATSTFSGLYALSRKPSAPRSPQPMEEELRANPR